MVSTKLSWSHFCEIIRVKTDEGRLFYAYGAIECNLSQEAHIWVITRYTEIR